VARGYWQCQRVLNRTVYVEKEVLVPSGLPPWIQPGPRVQIVSVPKNETYLCLGRYHEGPMANTEISCDCGTFAIGHCKECHKAVCGDHSNSGLRRLCLTCSTPSSSGGLPPEVSAALAKGERKRRGEGFA
jgi:hypothetical protein